MFSLLTETVLWLKVRTPTNELKLYID